MGIKIDTDLEKVLEFMQLNIPTDKLMHIAASVAALAPILWKADGGGFVFFRSELFREQQPVATQSHPAQACECGGFGAALDNQI